MRKYQLSVIELEYSTDRRREYWKQAEKYKEFLSKLPIKTECPQSDYTIRQYFTATWDRLRLYVHDYRASARTSSSIYYLYTLQTEYHGEILEVESKITDPYSGINVVKLLKDVLTNRIRSRRIDEKTLAYRSSELSRWYNGNVRLLGGVHVEPNQFLLALKQRQKAQLYDNKRPTNEKFHAGIEIECFFADATAKDKFEDDLIAAGLDEIVSISNDGSICCNHGSSHLARNSAVRDLC